MEEVFRDPEKYQGLETLMKSRISSLTTSLISTCIPNGLVNKFFYKLYMHYHFKIIFR
jgi:hypothetical protein